MSTTTTFEDEVRAMLTRRAADVPSDDATADPPLPAGLRIPVAAEPAGRGRGPWLAVAAAVALIAGVGGLLVATGDDPATERTDTTDGPTAPGPERPEHLSSLPGGVDPTVGPVRGVGPVAATPEAAMAATLGPVFGDEVTHPMPFGWLGDPDLWASWYGPLVSVDPGVWTVDSTERADVGGSVTARRTEGGWQAVAVTSAAIDLTGIGHDGAGLTGEVRVDAPAPLRVTVSSLAGDLLADTALTTGPGSDPDVSILSLEDLDDDLGGEPVVLRVEVGDRPGQVGFDGVGVAAFAAVVVPPGADPSAVVTTTTEAIEPDPPIAGGAGLAPGEGALWRASVADWGDAPGDAALAFARQALGAADAQVVGAPEGAIEPGTEVDVVVRLGSGVDVPVRLARDGGDWRVLLVDEGRVEVDRGGRGLGYTFGGPAAEAMGDQLVTVVRRDGSWERYGVGDDLRGLDDAAGWIVTTVDDEGNVLAATGNPS